jgi:hypothetical protein
MKNKKFIFRAVGLLLTGIGALAGLAADHLDMKDEVTEQIQSIQSQDENNEEA